MSVALRLQRAGAKGRPYYHIVATDKRNPRNGRFIEKIGAYNPMLAKDNPERVKIKEARAQYWLNVGAQPSERVQNFLFHAGITQEKPDISHKPKKVRKNPEKKTRQELKAEAEAEAKAQAQAAEAAAAEEAQAAEAAPAEEAAADEAAEETKTAE